MAPRPARLSAGARQRPTGGTDGRLRQVAGESAAGASKGGHLRVHGRTLPDDRVRAYLRTALRAGPADLSLIATVYSPAGEFTVTGPDVEPELLVRTAPPATGPEGPLALAAVEHERELPAVKHVGEVAKTYRLRQAVEQGCDDAAFVDRRGRLSEATIWNLAFSSLPV